MYYVCRYVHVYMSVFSINIFFFFLPFKNCQTFVTKFHPDVVYLTSIAFCFRGFYFCENDFS